MKPLIRALVVVSILSIASSFAGLGSRLFGTATSSVNTTPLASRIWSAAYGCGCLFFIWGIRNRPALAARIFPATFWCLWFGFVVGATLAGASQYPHETVRDEFLFGLIIAAASLFVALYWFRRLRPEFDALLEKHG
jgi:hypothetical protein